VSRQKEYMRFEVFIEVKV